MALVVGELTALITLDDSAVDPALRRTQQAMRQAGQQLGRAADDAGQQAGQELGGGFVRGADGRWRDMQANLVDAVTAATLEAESRARRGGQQVGQRFDDGVERGARQAGDDLADGVRRGAGDAADAAADAGDDASGSFLDRMRGSTSDGIGEIAGNIREGLASKLGLAAVGAAAGGALMSALNEAVEQEKIADRLGAKLGATGPQARKYGHIAGKLYADAVTEDFEGAADAIGAVMGAGLVDPTATNKQIQSISTNVADLATTFDQDLGGVVNAVSQMVRTGLAKNSKDALDILTKGFQSSANKADDLLDTFNEYGTQFRKAGVSGAQAVGLMNQAIQHGARDADIAADAIKEFSIRAVDGSTTTAQGFKALGLNADDMAKKFSKGGKTANGVLDLTLDKLRNVKDPVKQSQIAVELFGTQAEDLGQALYAMDPSKAVDTLGKVGGAADKMGDSLRDNSSTKVEQFKRGMKQGVVDFLGLHVVPALDNVRKGVGNLWADAGKGNQQGADRVVAFFDLLWQGIQTKMDQLVPKTIDGLSQAGTKIAEYIQSNPEGALKIGLIAGAIAAAIITLPVLVAASVLAAATVLVGNFTTSMISGINQKIPQLGSTIGGWFSGLWSNYVAGPVSRQWNSFMGTVRALPGRARSALGSLGSTLSGVASSAWGSFRDGTVNKATSAINWVRGLPHRAKSALSGLGGTLYNAGWSLISGFISGIRDRIPSVRSVLGGLTSSLTDWKGPATVDARILTPAGRLVISGFQHGIEQQTPALRRQLQGLTAEVPSMAMGAGAMSGGSGVTAGSSSAAPRVVKVGSDGSAFGNLLVAELRKKIGTLGGDVQFVLGG
ncbi:phage tail tape measure protein [Streptomyces sp. L2]|uniref:phage tail tape measure protein n=1 Tax=Streptomyces sp. L2 TaxID=2162665 RepID=UPI001011BEC9|nr:phage tail tape measure protein [Streptomyces sp. L2]